MARGEYERALELLEGAYLAATANSDATIQYARGLHQVGRYEDAERVLSLHLGERPEAAGGTLALQLARAKLARGDWSGAEE
ncbi:MAG TPA: tetratricopeptide repeat protein, partial [Thermoanaerobaculia bacterium]|nr:tetratricopeptide repeat protein [Thermoanaerobaculia bacterium]